MHFVMHKLHKTPRNFSIWNVFPVLFDSFIMLCLSVFYIKFMFIWHIHKTDILTDALDSTFYTRASSILKWALKYEYFNITLKCHCAKTLLQYSYWTRNYREYSGTYFLLTICIETILRITYSYNKPIVRHY